MDAREYLARKGLDGKRDEERPNTLEEKAWERARQSGEHRPHAGTPYDWEDWERYHDELAEDAGTIEQKIDRQAHRRESESDENGRIADTSVQHYEPSADPAAAQPIEALPTSEVPAHRAWAASPVLRFSLRGLAILMPPLAVGLSGGAGRNVAINLLLTLLGWIPGIVHAWRWLGRVLR
ncbi:YqaE/Pmp3 family membrane protein [Billgrantia pellis]|uniref:YqaE/Pmp3 family membrane protein n=1 Tax=Billgrantia pellis TaxID=2606936 RepID=A0A7V7G3L0_9GAMM|nr:YqaE/Pmp3 family membrane protein [Halomonas pellis]KAA0014152.1 YqaE/Pmp3 family membrane protein [Halomonas pellis]